jgi:hypothetical protein
VVQGAQLIRICIARAVRALALAAALGSSAVDLGAQATGTIRFIVVSDVHYGITRPRFRGGHDVAAATVNAAMKTAMNLLPRSAFPRDGGVDAGRTIGALDFVAVTGDIANRSENGVQSAAESWQQFTHDFLVGLTLTTADGQRTPVWAVPGNHDASNAIGYTKPLFPSTDATSMAQLYNRMVKPAVKRTATTYNYATDKVHFSRDVRGVHFSFLNVWPDSTERAWLDGDLRRAAAATPVILFVHVPPAGDPKLFTNPVGDHSLNAMDKFENLLSEQLKDSIGSTSATIESRAFAGFVRDHPRIAAYFHGHNNWNEFYTFTGPESTVALKTFRVDSPMKGKLSAHDESKLSFQVVTIDPVAGTMTVREFLWNASRSGRWGARTTVAIR